jgi:hypothetical protein
MQEANSVAAYRQSSEPMGESNSQLSLLDTSSASVSAVKQEESIEEPQEEPLLGDIGDDFVF